MQSLSNPLPLRAHAKQTHTHSLSRDPERGWDASRVKGVVAKLVRVKDPATATALEVTAGGRLYQVCVCVLAVCV
jgi:chromosome segregation ATPase